MVGLSCSLASIFKSCEKIQPIRGILGEQTQGNSDAQLTFITLENNFQVSEKDLYKIKWKLEDFV